MKILAISPRIPADGRKGDQILSYNRLAHLAQDHSIQLICFGFEADDLIAKQQLESIGIHVTIINWSKIQAAASVLLNIFNTHKPFQCALFESPAFRRAVASALINFNPEAIYAVTIRALGNLDEYYVPLFVDMVDSMALNFSRRVKTAKGAERFALNVEYQRVMEYEKLVAKKATRSFVVSFVDKKMIGCEKIDVIPLGIDMRKFFRHPDGKSDPIVAFTGNMSYKPNIDAVIWFYHNCWKQLQQAIPSVQLLIAGSNPKPEIIALRSASNITVTGRVPSLTTVLNSSRVSIAPMQSGSGMQFKILEAMACGVPVVASSLALGGMEALVNVDVMLADTPDTFTDVLISLLKSASLRTKIGDAGLRYVQSRHSWDVINKQFEQTLLTCISDPDDV